VVVFLNVVFVVVVVLAVGGVVAVLSSLES